MFERSTARDTDVLIVIEQLNPFFHSGKEMEINVLHIHEFTVFVFAQLILFYP